MEGIFKEFENENELRSYPFAAGCVPPDDEEDEIPAGLFVDAALYPINPSGVLYMSMISEDGTISISDDTGVIMTGTHDGSTVEFHDTTGFRRHVGTMIASSPEALDEFLSRKREREYSEDNASFASSCVFPVVIDGVLSVAIGEADAVAGSVSFSNASTDAVRVSSMKGTDGNDTLRFDVLPQPEIEDDASIRRIICVVDGRTPFRIDKLAYNTIALKLNGIDKETICTAAHRENQYEMADTCKCQETGTCPDEPDLSGELPEHYKLIEVYIPPDQKLENGGTADGADNAFFLVVPNVNGYDNPISITLEDGATIADINGIETVRTGDTAELAEGEFIDKMTSKGVVIQVPGLSGGSI